MIRPDHAGVKIPPPLVYLVALVVGLWWDSPWFSGQGTSPVAMTIGGAVTALGMCLVLSAAAGLWRAGTHLEPWRPTTTLLSQGVYRHSRNPIYLGMAIGQFGLAICGASLAAALTLIPAIIIIQTQVIAREELYLEHKFGQPYRDYKTRVRRWI